MLVGNGGVGIFWRNCAGVQVNIDDSCAIDFFWFLEIALELVVYHLGFASLYKVVGSWVEDDFFAEKYTLSHSTLELARASAFFGLLGIFKKGELLKLCMFE